MYQHVEHGPSAAIWRRSVLALVRGTGAGYLACGWIGKGRLAEPEDIVEAAF
jgi:hypothetical protein